MTVPHKVEYPTPSEASNKAQAQAYQAVQTEKEERQIFSLNKVNIEAQNCTALLSPYTK